MLILEVRVQLICELVGVGNCEFIFIVYECALRRMLRLGLEVLEQHKFMLVQGPERVLRMRVLVFLAIFVAILPDALVTT